MGERKEGKKKKTDGEWRPGAYWLLGNATSGLTDGFGMTCQTSASINTMVQPNSLCSIAMSLLRRAGPYIYGPLVGGTSLHVSCHRGGGTGGSGCYGTIRVNEDGYHSSCIIFCIFLESELDTNSVWYIFLVFAPRAFDRSVKNYPLLLHFYTRH